ncbi:MAG TPA: dethiobiotin synthase [Kofleriaceae bacterium]|nr:dethiobiotin synthase [Kofleriaceae bacterium]
MIIVVSGTGTGVGKTHVAVALVRALAARGPVVAWKPVESGVEDPAGPGEDEAALAARSAVHVPSVRLRAPISPHLAARREGVRIDPAALHRRWLELASAWPAMVVELAGGLCSPLDDALDSAGWLAAAPPAIRAGMRLLLVAPDRLGVLHDAAAALHACAAHGLAARAIALSAPATADASTGTNAAELSARTIAAGLSIVRVPRAPSAELAAHPGIGELLAALAA